MSKRCLGCLFLLLSLNSLGCMQTRHVEISSSAVASSSGSCHDATCQERRWWGFWLGQPEGVRP